MEYVVIAFFCGLSAGVIGKLKGSSFFIWFLVGAVLPLLGTIAAACYRVEHREPRRACPECGSGPRPSPIRCGGGGPGRSRGSS